MNEEILEVLSETISDVILTLDKTGTIIFCSSASTQIFGWHPDYMVGNHVCMIMPERLREAHRRGFNRYLESGQKTLNWKAVETIGLRKDESEFPVEIAFGEYTKDGEKFLSGVVRDITDRKVVEDAQIKKQFELERINDELEHFVYAVSHDLQEPIRAIYSYVELLQKKEVLTATTKKYLSSIQGNAKRLETFVSALLKHAQVGHTVGTEILPTNQVVNNAIKDLDVAIKESDAIIEYDSLLNVNVDPVNLRQIFQNLLENSIKYRRKNVPPRIRIVSRLLYNYVQFSVIDNGIGIQDDELNNIFSLFQRLPTEHSTKGFGLGLAIVKKIVETYNGRINVASEKDEGTTVYFSLPKGDL